MLITSAIVASLAVIAEVTTVVDLIEVARIFDLLIIPRFRWDERVV
jgi:hypothetical protein